MMRQSLGPRIGPTGVIEALRNDYISGFRWKYAEVRCVSRIENLMATAILGGFALGALGVVILLTSGVQVSPSVFVGMLLGGPVLGVIVLVVIRRRFARQSRGVLSSIQEEMKKLSDKEKLALIVGGMVVFLMLLGIVVPDDTVEYADIVLVDYTGITQATGERMDNATGRWIFVGTAADLQSYKYPTSNPRRHEFGPEPSLVIEGLWRELIGAEIGTTYEVVVEPDEGYGHWDPARTTIYPIREDGYARRLANLTFYNLEDRSNVDYDTQTGEYVWINAYGARFDAEVVRSKNGTFDLYLLVENGTDVVADGIPATLTNVSRGFFSILHKPVEGRDYGPGRVTTVTESSFIVDTNHPGAGKTLLYSVSLVDKWEPPEPGPTTHPPQDDETEDSFVGEVPISVTLENHAYGPVWVNVLVLSGTGKGGACSFNNPMGFRNNGDYYLPARSTKDDVCLIRYPADGTIESAAGLYLCGPESDCREEDGYVDDVPVSRGTTLKVNIVVSSTGGLNRSYEETT